MRRIYTHDGEFYSLSENAALARLHAGLEVFQRYNWPVQGFVAPAWLMSPGTRQALRQLPLRYTSGPQHLYRLPDFSPIAAPAWCGAPAAPGADKSPGWSTPNANDAGDRHRSFASACTRWTCVTPTRASTGWTSSNACWSKDAYR